MFLLHSDCSDIRRNFAFPPRNKPFPKIKENKRGRAVRDRSPRQIAVTNRLSFRRHICVKSMFRGMGVPLAMRSTAGAHYPPSAARAASWRSRRRCIIERVWPVFLAVVPTPSSAVADSRSMRLHMCLRRSNGRRHAPLCLRPADEGVGTTLRHSRQHVPKKLATPYRAARGIRPDLGLPQPAEHCRGVLGGCRSVGQIADIHDRRAVKAVLAQQRHQLWQRQLPPPPASPPSLPPHTARSHRIRQRHLSDPAFCAAHRRQ